MVKRGRQRKKEVAPMVKKGRQRKEEVAESSSVDGVEQRSTFVPSALQYTGRVTRQQSRLAFINQYASSSTPVRKTKRFVAANDLTFTARRVLLEDNHPPTPESFEEVQEEYVRDSSELLHTEKLPDSAAIPLGQSSPQPQEYRCGNGQPVQNLSSIVLSPTQRPSTIPQTQPHNGVPVAEAAADKAENIGTSVNDKISQLNPTTSLNLTEIALMCNGGGMDDDEVQSANDPPRVTVEGYRVKPEVACLLRQILAKHGDIAKDFILQSRDSRAYLLELVCSIYQNLKEKTFEEITPVELDRMLRTICELESSKLNVGWIHTQLLDIKYGKELVSDYVAFKEEQWKIKKERQHKESQLLILRKEVSQLLILQQKVLQLEDELATMEAKNEERTQKFMEMKEKIRTLHEEGLVHGLL